MTEPYRGIYAIQYSTFRADGYFDESDFESQVEFTIAAGAHGIVWPVMASEFTVLTESERRRSTELLLKRAAGRIPVVIGVATVWTEASVALAQHAEENGADAIISLPPYVQKPTRDQAFTFYQALADAVKIPLFLQNAGGAMGMAFSAEEVAKMTAEIPGLDYVKEETAPMGQSISRVLAACGNAVKGVFAGGACRELPRELARGAAGNMSSSALSDVFVAMYERYTGGDHAGAREVQFRLLTYLNLQNIYGHGLVREVLRRRGVIQSAHPRFGKGMQMDEHDALELDFAWEQLQPYFRL
jgi:dihydrodipicolinate synthase/N-acetylneuraminate lyase